MKYGRFAAALLAAALAAAACGTGAAASDDARLEALLDAAGRREMGRKQAAALRAELDARVSREPLETLWKRAVGRGAAARLDAAWSVLRAWCPEGDVSRWAEVNYLQTPSLRPRALMVIDALYVALIELRRVEGGEWLASDLLREFSRSSHGRYDFLGVCPAPVAEALDDIVARTGMIGLWKPRLVTGRLPIARPVRGAVPETLARDEGMQFLDGACLPANGGIYAWDRRTGRIYNVIYHFFGRR